MNETTNPSAVPVSLPDAPLGHLQPEATPQSASLVLDQYSVPTLAESLRAAAFNLVEEVRLLINVMRSGTNRDKLAAQRQYRLLMRELLELSGYIASASQQQSSTTADGITTSRTAGSSRLISHLQKDNPYGQAPDPNVQRALSPVDGIRVPPLSLPTGTGTFKQTERVGRLLHPPVPGAPSIIPHTEPRLPGDPSPLPSN